MFNSIGYSKKRSPMSLFMLTGLTLLQVVSVGLYTYTFFREQTIRNDYVIDSVARFSYTVFIIGAVLFIIGTVFAWLYVDWKYVKQKEE
jgi:TRAP-type mannitol/chloroaromatic compound transport system permease small subunit